MFNRLKHRIKQTFFPPWEPKLDIQVEVTRFGQGYNGWNILTDGISETSNVYSFGVGEDATFDLELIKRFKLTVHAFDPTPKSIAWVKQQQMPEQFILHEYGIASSNCTMDFYPPENPNFVSHTILQREQQHGNPIKVPLKDLSSIVKELNCQSIDILKIDIEGAEYSVIENILSTAIRPKQFLIEFHHRFPEIGIRKTKKAVKQLKKKGYQLYSVSDSGEEYSFVYTPKK